MAKKLRPIDNLYNSMKAIEQKMSKLRASCKHKKFHIGWYSWRIGSINPQRICDRCDAIVPGLTEAEAEVLREEQNFLGQKDGIV